MALVTGASVWGRKREAQKGGTIQSLLGSWKHQPFGELQWLEHVVGNLLPAKHGSSPWGSCLQTGHRTQKVQAWFEGQPLAALTLAVADSLGEITVFYWGRQVV